jgi:predicted ABC-type ATPase
VASTEYFDVYTRLAQIILPLLPIPPADTGLALRRIKARVKQGGHDVPKPHVLRRFKRSWENFERGYRPLADRWSVYENSGVEPILLERGP